MSDREHDEIMQTMSDNNNYQNEPKLGIFWYDQDGDVLFGVTKIEAMDIPFPSEAAQRKTVRTLHKSWWKKQEMRYRTGHEKSPVFAKDYTEIPRGRLFQRRDGVFEIMCGSWINEHIVDLVVEEFDLQGQKVENVIDEHWELGHGWSEDVIK